LEVKIDSLFDELVETLYVVIETPYVDKFYRDSYYTYFASKHKKYNRDCIRLSFFMDEISQDHFRNTGLFGQLQDYFLGYLILRPTVPNIIGRSIISKRAFKDSDMLICSYQSDALVNGIKLNIKGFPHSSQDGESITCAETTIWAMMEYFGNRYSNYRPIAISEIISVLTKYSNKRMLPSSGLTVEQISYSVKEFGFGTFLYSREDAYEDEIENIVSIYVESGIPVLAVLENENIGHAVLVIGYEKENVIDFDVQEKREIAFSTGTVRYIDYSDVERKYIFQDDNLFPLRKLHLSDPVALYQIDGWHGAQIDSVIVPLYKKIYLEAEMAKQLALNVLKDQVLGFPFQEEFIFRFFLTSSRSFKFHIAKLENMSKKIANEVILLQMPKFIWVAEIYVKELYSNNLASGLVILDATEANKQVKDTILLGLYPDRCIFKSGNNFVTLNEELNHYLRFQNNLD